MNVDPSDRPASNQEMFAYFRMGLATGIVAKETAVEWADYEIMQPGKPDYDVIELSLSGRLPYSQIVWLLNRFQEGANFTLPLHMLLARAGIWLEQSPERGVDLIMSLRLLKAEAFLPAEIKAELTDLQTSLDAYERQLISYAELAGDLTTFLRPYAVYRSWLFFGS